MFGKVRNGIFRKRRELMHLLVDCLASFRPELSVNLAGGVRIRLDLASGLTETSIADPFFARYIRSSPVRVF